MNLIDTHAHLCDKKFKHDRKEVIKRFRDNGIEKVITVAYDVDTIQPTVDIASEYDFIYATAGIHPHDSANAPEDFVEKLGEWCKHPQMVALGEMGLDYYRDMSPREVQRRVFREQLALAREVDMPVIIHDRDAHEEVMEIFKNDGIGRAKGVMHCFSGDSALARECMDMGFYISFAGPVTFKNARGVKEVAASVPLERLLVETDCPYLAPEPYRGKRNEPAYVRYVAEEIARIKDISLEELASAVSSNAEELFRLK